MSRVFVTVGTTPFPRLVSFFDSVSSRHEIVLQTATAHQVTHAALAFDRAPDIEEWYDWADIVVSHAGAGTVYHLLERRTPLCVVPNLDRADQHQRELADFVRTNALAYVAESLDRYTDPDSLIDAAIAFKAKPYTKRAFFAAAPLLRLLRSPELGLDLPSHDDVVE